jgi:hypothetical protein
MDLSYEKVKTKMLDNTSHTSHTSLVFGERGKNT